ncbi:hypothetical protein J2Y73_001958 [Peribacillus frigoritolerans]|jgi:hypothetical protein|uniref:hypothetical protein n=1 Tax=Peribacillus frigoritolerans TaxID=450367 RepID=UPI00209C8BE8|nr:hypothetical protein [Peribacillus frigoritolerans]MCP1491927.1 hypothetical protein [Peribacillus frigoritolerans]
MQKVTWSIELDEPMKLKDELIKKELRYCMELDLTQAPVKDRKDCNLEVGNEIKIHLSRRVCP